LQYVFPLDILMVPSFMLTVAADGECASCNAFSLGETIHFGSLEFITDRFSGLSLSPLGDGSEATVMGSTRSRPPSPLRAMTGNSAEEFHTDSDEEGRTDLSSLRRHGTGASTALPQPYHGRSLDNHSTTTSGVMARAPARGGKDSDDGLHPHPSSAQRRGSHRQS
jgi:hypothetical protein